MTVDVRARAGIGRVLVTIAAVGFVALPFVGAILAEDFDLLRSVTSELGAGGVSGAAFMNTTWIVLAVVLAIGVLMARPVPTPWAMVAGFSFTLSYIGSALLPCSAAECNDATELQSLHGFTTVFDVVVGLFFVVSVVVVWRRGELDVVGLLLLVGYLLSWTVGGINFLVNDWFGLFQRLAELFFLAWLVRASTLSARRADSI